MSKAYAAPADTWPKKGSSGNGTIIGYSVEARYAFPDPALIAGHPLDTRWKRIHFPKGHGGVPERASIHDPACHGLHSYCVAQALRWWFHAEADMGIAGCLETRIIEHRVTYSYSEEAVGAYALVGGDDRSNLMPNWGKRTAGAVQQSEAEPASTESQP